MKQCVHPAGSLKRSSLIYEIQDKTRHVTDRKYEMIIIQN